MCPQDNGRRFAWRCVTSGIIAASASGPMTGHATYSRHPRFVSADAARFVDPGDQEADEQLDDAAEQLRTPTVTSGISRGSSSTVPTSPSPVSKRIWRCQWPKKSAERHPGLDDDELVANLHRVCADAQWLRRDPGAALDAYARAVAHAYRFQVEDVQDEYTDAFQQEMIDRSMERLVTMHADGQDEGHAVLRSACARIRAFFGRTGARWEVAR